jgi:hypothetical protein
MTIDVTGLRVFTDPVGNYSNPLGVSTPLLSTRRNTNASPAN